MVDLLPGLIYNLFCYNRYFNRVDLCQKLKFVTEKCDSYNQVFIFVRLLSWQPITTTDFGRHFTKFVFSTFSEPDSGAESSSSFPELLDSSPDLRERIVGEISNNYLTHFAFIQ